MESKRGNKQEESYFSEIYDTYWERLYRYVIRILPDEDDVMDIVQETFVTFWEMGVKVEKLRSVKSYLFVIARNLAFRRFRERARQQEFENRLVEFYGEASSDAFAGLHTRELAAVIDAAVQKLPDRMREVFVLSRKEHLSYQEIAQRLQISDQTVKKQISKSLRYLRLKLDEEYISYLIILLAIDLAC